MKVDVSLPGDKTLHLEGEARFLDNAVDTTTATIQMKAVLPNADEKITPGQFLNVSLLLDTLAKTITVPNEAVQQGVNGNFVYVVKEDNSVEMRKIETAASEGGVTAIRTGVLADETVVTDGQLRLAPGVRIKSTATDPTSPVISPANADTPATPANK